MAAAVFDPASSTSAFRASRSTSNAISMADNLPSVDFKFDELRERMARFTVRFDDFIERGRKRVLEERNQFRMNVAEMQEDHRIKNRDVEILQLKTTSHVQSVAKESQETNEMHSAITSLTTQRDEHATHRDALLAHISSVQATIASRKAAQQAHARHLSQQARFNVPELDFWENNLCMRIEGAGAVDRLKFVFTHVCETDWEREAWFELGTGSRDYQVFSARPKLEREDIERCVEKLNESRDLAPFLKGMRELFIRVMK
ncbi:hypothetical protein P152DRAFT_483877 [Eremomyces bilateralis CBS 781.70]|uniref:Kinetochore protein SPC25 n=1 Tax=Eremomyces bilateralis CBS 781.70 TaxID=1392243 RepID=A0A6G1FXA3_9PEZI|nr:uncharacterized protein P152DRAFT_483877 [Eremomyces bilateralis CBS 781.70]KAF1810413.1 hypothetical protein P152DRAFT_483877 [Eremomyces bilateralis CBS 781.70]